MELAILYSEQMKAALQRMKITTTKILLVLLIVIIIAAIVIIIIIIKLLMFQALSKQRGIIKEITRNIE